MKSFKQIIEAQAKYTATVHDFAGEKGTPAHNAMTKYAKDNNIKISKAKDQSGSSYGGQTIKITGHPKHVKKLIRTTIDPDHNFNEEAPANILKTNGKPRATSPFIPRPKFKSSEPKKPSKLDRIRNMIRSNKPSGPFGRPNFFSGKID